MPNVHSRPRPRRRVKDGHGENKRGKIDVIRVKLMNHFEFVLIATLKTK